MHGRWIWDSYPVATLFFPAVDFCWHKRDLLPLCLGIWGSTWCICQHACGLAQSCIFPSSSSGLLLEVSPVPGPGSGLYLHSVGVGRAEGHPVWAGCWNGGDNLKHDLFCTSKVNTVILRHMQRRELLVFLQKLPAGCRRGQFVVQRLSQAVQSLQGVLNWGQEVVNGTVKGQVGSEAGEPSGSTFVPQIQLQVRTGTKQSIAQASLQLI